jgi:integrase
MHTRKHPRSGKWVASVPTRSGRPITKTFDRKVDAERWGNEQEAKRARGAQTNTTLGKTLFKDYAEEWRSVQQWKRTTASTVESILRLRIFPYIGDRPLNGIVYSDVQRVVSQLSEKYAPRSVHAAIVQLGSVMDAALKDRLIDHNPCRDVSLPKIRKEKVNPLSLDDISLIIEYLPDHLKVMARLSATTGLRLGECSGLTVDRFDMLRRRVTVDRQLCTPDSGPPYFSDPKSEASNRVVPVPQQVIDEVAKHLASRGITGSTDDLVFVNTKGNPLRRGNIGHSFGLAVKKSGIERETTFHDLRHHYASLLIWQGLNVVTVQHMLGHASSRETLDTYAHLWPDAEEQAREAVELALSVARQIV